ncbi:hypothetical protein [Qipengyuania sp. 902]|uniref:hypothetical protein n=1 Tax=Qipengyuania sp. 902 TaxID=3417565 RepID=UPI003EBCB1F7
MVLLIAFVFYLNRRWLEVCIIGVPLLICGYFLLSVGIFSFGENMPFAYYDHSRHDEYGFVSAMMCLHFFAVMVAFLVVGRYDKRYYLADQLGQIRSLGLGTAGALFCLLPVVFVTLSLSAPDLWYRTSFRYETGASNLLRFADLLVLLSAILIPFIRNRILKYAVLVAVTLAFLALGSRTAIVVLIIFSVMNLFVLQKTRTWLSIVILIAAFWLLGVVLLLRSYNLGGLFAVLETAFTGDYAAIGERMVYGLNYNFNLSFVLIAELLSITRADERWFYYGVLPLPSAFFDMTEQYDALNRFRTNIPYSGFGYALSYLGPVRYLAFVFVSSLAFLAARKRVSKKRDIFEAILCFGVFVFPFIILLQYNLRTGTRIAYVFLIFYFLLASWQSGLFAPRKQRSIGSRV